MNVINPIIRPIIRGVVKQFKEEPEVWSPLRLFEAGQDGAYYDVDDLDTIWQDVAGTIPVTADGQQVKRIDDLSGNGHHMIATGNSGQAPVYRAGGGKPYLEFPDSVDRRMTAQSLFATANFGMALLWDITTSDQQGFVTALDGGVTGKISVMAVREGPGLPNMYVSLPITLGNASSIYTNGVVGSVAIPNNVPYTLFIDATANPQADPLTTETPLTIGSERQYGTHPHGRAYAWIWVGDTRAQILDSVKRNLLIAWLQDKLPVVALGPNLITNGDFSSGMTGWFEVSPTVTLDAGGWLNVAFAGTNNANAEHSGIPTTNGLRYRLEFDCVACLAGNNAIIYCNSSPSYNVAEYIPAVGHYKFDFTCTQSPSYVQFTCSAGTLSIDNVTIKEILPDLGPELFTQWRTISPPWVGSGAGPWSIDGSQTGNAAMDNALGFVPEIGAKYQVTITLGALSGTAHVYAYVYDPLPEPDYLHVGENVYTKVNPDGNDLLNIAAEAGTIATITKVSVRKVL